MILNLIVSVIIILGTIAFIFSVKETIEGRYLRPEKIAEVMAYAGMILEINQTTILKMEEKYITLEDFEKPILIGYHLTLEMENSILEEKNLAVTSVDNVRFQNPWNKDVKEALKQKYKKMKSERKENERQTKLLQKERKEELARRYKQIGS